MVTSGALTPRQMAALAATSRHAPQHSVDDDDDDDDDDDVAVGHSSARANREEPSQWLREAQQREEADLKLALALSEKQQHNHTSSRHRGAVESAASTSSSSTSLPRRLSMAADVLGDLDDDDDDDVELLRRKEDADLQRAIAISQQGNDTCRTQVSTATTAATTLSTSPSTSQATATATTTNAVGAPDLRGRRGEENTQKPTHRTNHSPVRGYSRLSRDAVIEVDDSQVLVADESEIVLHSDDDDGDVQQVCT